MELQFEIKGELKHFHSVELQINEGEKQVSAALQQDRSKPGHVIVSCSASHASLPKLTFRVLVAPPGAPGMDAYDLHVKDFVDLDKLRR